MAQKIILSQTARPELVEYIESLGYEVELFGPIGTVQAPLSCHPDMVFCRLGGDTVYTGDPTMLGPDYPQDIIYNACSTGKYFIHNLKYTAPELLEAAERLDLRKVNVSQGYAKCSTCVVSEDAIITYDRGIARATRAAGLDVLTIEPGHVELPGYDTGFIGGASGLVRDLRNATGAAGASGLVQDLRNATDAAGASGLVRDLRDTEESQPILIFNGDLPAHPDARAIMDFAEEHGVRVKYFSGWKLTDIGSII